MCIFRFCKGKKGDKGDKGEKGDKGDTGPIGPIGPRGFDGGNDDLCLPSAPAYPYDECATCERPLEGETEPYCPNLQDRFYVLCVRPDNTTAWVELNPK